MYKSRFWENKPLNKLTKKEWESLCDGCGRCCLMKLEDEEAGDIFYTDVACKLLNQKTGRCKSYARRVEIIPDCLVLGPDKPEYFRALPASCAYRRLYEGKKLADWHPLISGDRDSVRQAGISIHDQCISEEYIHPDELETRIIEFDK